jgi:hypothetical protein
MQGTRVSEYSTKTSDRAEAERMVAQFEEDWRAGELRHQEKVQLASANFERTGKSLLLAPWAATIWRIAKHRAVRDGIRFDLSERDMIKLVKRADDRCEVSGVPFTLDRARPSSRRPYTASLDRIQSEGAYTFENCRLVCYLVNLAMNDWGTEPLIKISLGVVNNMNKLGYPR